MVFKAQDGQTFDTEAACRDHEERLEIQQHIDAYQKHLIDSGAKDRYAKNQCGVIGKFMDWMHQQHHGSKT